MKTDTIVTMMWLQVQSVIDKITAKEGKLLNKTMESQMAV